MDRAPQLRKTGLIFQISVCVFHRLKNEPGEFMKTKNMFAKVAAAVAISVVALSGCSSSNDTPKSPGTQVSSEVTQSANLTTDSAAKFVSDYYAGWFKETDATLYTTLQDTITNIVGESADLTTVDINDPIAFFNNLPEDKQLELAEKMTELNKNSSFYDLSQLTLSEKSFLNIMVISMTSVLGNGESITVSADASKIVVDGNTATVPFSALTVKYGDTESPALANSDGFDLPLIGVDGEWKVDGKKFLDVILTELNEDSGSIDSGSTDSETTGN